MAKVKDRFGLIIVCRDELFERWEFTRYDKFTIGKTNLLSGHWSYDGSKYHDRIVYIPSFCKIIRVTANYIFLKKGNN